MYVRFQSLDESPYTGEKYGIFVAVWHLIRDKKVANEEEVAYWEHRAWFEDALTDEMKTCLYFYFDLAKKYGVTIIENTTDSLDDIMYEDNFQVAVIPKK